MSFNDKNERKKIQQSASNLERLIRLERRNRIDHFSPRTYGSEVGKTKKEKVSGNSNVRFKDQLLKSYWEDIEKSYFKKIMEEDLTRLDWILYNILSDKNPAESLFYADYNSFLSMIDWYDTVSQVHRSLSSMETEDRFWRNFLKLYFIKVKCYLPLLLQAKKIKEGEALSPEDIKKAKELKKFLKGISYQKLEYSEIDEEEHIIELDLQNRKKLDDESDILDDLIKQITPKEEHADTEIDIEVKLIKSQIDKISKINSQKLISMKYDHSAFTQEQLNKEDISQYRRELRGKPNIRNHYNLYLQEKYLKSIIFMLEIRQIAESSKAILDVRAIKGKELLVEIAFENCITKRSVLIHKKHLMQIEKHRDFSLLAIIENTRIIKEDGDVSYILPGEPYTLKEIKKMSSARKLRWRDELEKWDVCHHCTKTYLNTCLYKCTRKGKSCSSSNKKTSREKQVKNYINAFLCDNKLDSRTSCGRKFCAACLKANYEDNSYFLPKWTCPFCKGTCFCSRCQRGEILKKFYLYYLKNGGTKTFIKYESPLIEIVDLINDSGMDENRIRIPFEVN